MITAIYERRFYTLETDNGTFERGPDGEWIKHDDKDDSWSYVEDTAYIESAFQAALGSEIHFVVEDEE